MTDPERPRTTPEGHTPEEPRPSELGKRGSPGAGMTAEVPHVADARAVDDDHAHAEPRLGPIDWPAWSYAVIGAALALLVIAAFYVAIS